ncbi:MAG: cyclic nucleotide-binding domain-containing protein [Deltaproteobacteria bacterium]|nr:cyclic nucleotide-binding domain-containing protein [Deltaproteobacteria bacterium]
MLEEITKNPALQKYLGAYETGHIVFLEGDETQDLYILVSGELEILKGNKKIAEITEKGSLFGEMSFLLGARRTATAKAMTAVKALRIPKEELTNFLNEFPTVAKKITRLLARRLDETSQILYGLKEFCDQLPDAVILTDKDGKILTWNSSAEKLYGRNWHQMRHKSVEEIYEKPEVYRSFIEEVQSRYSVREKILTVRHPEKGLRYISTSTTVLYDGHHNFQGVLSLGRDVTSVKRMERSYRRAKYWMIPSLFLLALLGLAVFLGYPYFSKGIEKEDFRKHGLRNQMAKDYLMLQSLLAGPMEEEDRPETGRIMKDFFEVQETESTPYTGLILLDREKKVMDAYSVLPDLDYRAMVGNSYAGIEFQGTDRSLHRVLTVYRVDKEHPMGHKGIEIAFRLFRGKRFLGWLVFQMRTDLLAKQYNIDEEGLKRFHFEKP